MRSNLNKMLTYLYSVVLFIIIQKLWHLLLHLKLFFTVHVNVVVAVKIVVITIMVIVVVIVVGISFFI